jgi:hypothetical protein
MDPNQVVDLICEPDATASKCKVAFENGNMLVSILIKGAKKVNVDKCNENAATRCSINIDRRLHRSPREILTEIFKIHGRDLDPQSFDPAFEAIAEAVRSNLSPTMDPTSASTEEPADSPVPLKKYDCFIGYRNASERNIAENLYLYLKGAGFNPFLEKRCLKFCEDWKTGFLSGLQ